MGSTTVDLKTLEHLEDRYLKEILAKHSPDNRVDLSANLQKLSLELDLLNINKIGKLTPENEVFFLNKVKELNYGYKNMPTNPEHNALVFPFVAKLFYRPSFHIQIASVKHNVNCILHLTDTDPDCEELAFRKNINLAKEKREVHPDIQKKIAFKDPKVAIKIKNLTEEALEIALEKNYKLISEIAVPQTHHLLFALNKEFLELQTKNLTVSNYEGVVDKDMLTLYKTIPCLSHFETHTQAMDHLKKTLYLKIHL